MQDTPILKPEKELALRPLGIMTIQSVGEVYAMNRKARTRMSVGKGRKPIDAMLIQEGVYSHQMAVNNAAIAGPVY